MSSIISIVALLVMIAAFAGGAYVLCQAWSGKFCDSRQTPTDRRRCKRCGNLNPLVGKFCGRCGKKIEK